MLLTIHLRNPQERVLAKAAAIIRAGGVVVYPTDTVYGIACSILDTNAIERVYLIKRERPEKPFSFVCADLSHISEYARVSNSAFKIMRRLIPGPYTFVLPAARMAHLPRILVSRRKTVGIRVPDSPVVRALLSLVGHPILSTSAMRTGEERLPDAQMIVGAFRDQVDLVLDGGPLVSNLSTVLDLTGEDPVIVRRGAGDLSSIGL